MSAAALYIAARVGIYICILLLVGCQATRWLAYGTPMACTADSESCARSTRRIAAWSATLLLVLIVVRGYLQTASFLDPGETITAALGRTVLLDSDWGHAWTLQVVATLCLLLLLRLTRPSAASISGVEGLLAAMILWAQSGMGHAAGDNWHGPWGRLLDSAHLAGGGIWLGALAVLTVTTLPLLRRPAELPILAALVRRYSLCARTGVALILVTGLTAAIIYAGSVNALLHARWGRVLLIKLGVMCGILAMGWYNWRIVTPALEQCASMSERRLRRAIRLELVLGLAILAVTSLLVVSPLPGES